MIKSATVFLLCLFVWVPVLRADSDLENAMKDMGKAYKQLGLDLKAPQDASKNDYLALAASIKAAAQKSRDLVPKKASSLPDDQKATMVAAYQKSMDELIATTDMLATAIQNSQWDDARKAMDTLKQQMLAGHKEFRLKKGEKPPTSLPAGAAPVAGGTPAAAPEAPAQNTPPANPPAMQ